MVACLPKQDRSKYISIGQSDNNAMGISSSSQPADILWTASASRASCIWGRGGQEGCSPKYFARYPQYGISTLCPESHLCSQGLHRSIGFQHGAESCVLPSLTITPSHNDRSTLPILAPYPLPPLGNPNLPATRRLQLVPHDPTPLPQCASRLMLPRRAPRSPPSALPIIYPE